MHKVLYGVIFNLFIFDLNVRSSLSFYNFLYEHLGLGFPAVKGSDIG